MREYIGISVMAEISIANIHPNESIELKLYSDQTIHLTQSKCLTGIISKINDINLNKLDNDVLSRILSHPVNTIEIEPCSSEPSGLLRSQIVYLGIPDGSIGIDIEPVVVDGDTCGGLKVTNPNHHIAFHANDIIISINNIELNSISVSSAIQLLVNTEGRTLTIMRSPNANVAQISPSLTNYERYGSDYIPTNVLVHRSRGKKYTSRSTMLTNYRDFICGVQKRFSSRPSFDYLPSIDLRR